MAGARASYRFFEFFTANIGNPNKRRASGRTAIIAAWKRRQSGSKLGREIPPLDGEGGERSEPGGVRV